MTSLTIITVIAGIAALFIVFSIRFHQKNKWSFTIATILAIIVSIALYTLVLHYEMEKGLFLIYMSGGFAITCAYGWLSSSGINNTEKHPKHDQNGSFSLELANGKRIYFGDPCTNFLVYGGAGSGKTKSIGKPLLEQYIKHGWAGMITDYKDYDYTKTAYALVKKYGYKNKFYYMNFVDLSRSYRCNIIKPSVVRDDALLVQLIDDILLAYAGDAKKDEWYLGAAGIFKGVAVRFFYDYPQYCNLPVVVNFIAQSTPDKIEKFLAARPESKALGKGFLDASDSKKTQASYLSTLTSYISDFAFNKKLHYVLSGDDFDFNLIDPKDPKLFAVSNSFQYDSLISPVIALMMVLNFRQFTMRNEVYFFNLMDEATTFKVRDFEKNPSVLREYKCSFVLLTQSGAKIEKLYGKLDRSSIESNFANLFLGRTKDPEALKYYSIFFSKKEEERRTFTTGTSTNNNSSSISKTKTRETRYEPEFFTRLKQGEFVGSAAQSNMPEFHLQLKQFVEPPGAENGLPVIHEVTDQDVQKNYEEIIQLVASIE